MLSLKNRSRIYLILVIIVIFSGIIRFIPFYLSNFLPPALDPVTLSYEANNILENEDFANIEYYPLSSFLVAFSSLMFNIPTYKSVSVLTLILGSLIPIFVYCVVKNVYNDCAYGIISAFFASTLNCDLRTVTYAKLSNILGLIILWCILLFLIKYNTKEKKYLVIALFLLSTLIFVHIFTFFTLVCILAIYFIIKIKNKKYLIPTLCLLMFLMYVGKLFFSGGNLNIKDYIILFLYEGNIQYAASIKFAHPLWDHPATWGYTLTVLGLIGLKELIFKPNIKNKELILLFLVVPVLWANTRYIHFLLIPHRFLFYGSIGLLLLVPLGFEKLSILKKFKNGKLLYNAMIISIILSTTVHALSFELSDYHDWGKTTLPTEDDMEAMEWMKENVNDSYCTLSIGYWPFMQAGNWSRILAERKFLCAPPTWKDAPKKPTYETLKPHGIIGSIIQPFLNEKVYEEEKKYQLKKWEKSFDLWFILANVDSEKSTELMDKYDIKYIYMYSSAPENNKIKNSNNFIVIYKKGDVIIYERKD